MNRQVTEFLTTTSLGAIAWAVRGTGGWGGFDGALVPGFFFAIIVVLYDWLDNSGEGQTIIDERGQAMANMAPWLGFAIAFGGMMGYGPYISCLRGNMGVGYEDVGIYPLVAFAWLWVVGFGWIGFGLILGVRLGSGEMWRDKLAFLAISSLGGLLGLWIFEVYPSYFVPNWDLLSYNEPGCTICVRIYETNRFNFFVLAFVLTSFVSDFLQARSVATVRVFLLSVLFGIAYSLSAAWTLLYGVVPGVDWWKLWELSSGFAAGAVIFFFRREASRSYWASFLGSSGVGGKGAVKAVQESTGQQAKTTGSNAGSNVNTKDRHTPLLSLGLSFLFYHLSLLWGGSYTLGVRLGLYDVSLDSYAWPSARIVLASLIGLVLLLYSRQFYVRLTKLVRETIAGGAGGVTFLRLEKFGSRWLIMQLFAVSAALILTGFISMLDPVILRLYILFAFVGLTGLYFHARGTPFT